MNLKTSFIAVFIVTIIIAVMYMSLHRGIDLDKRYTDWYGRETSMRERWGLGK